MEKWKEKILPWIGFLPMVILAICVGVSLNGYKAPVFDVVKAQEMPDNKDKVETSAVKEGTTKAEESTQMETAKEGGTYKDGTYTGTGKGFGGQMTVQVTVKDGKITQVKILNHKDGASYINRASSILSAIVAKQSTNVDTVSGATYSSVGIIQATRNALSKAMADGATLEETSALPATTTNSGSANKGSKTVSKVKDADGYKDGTYTGTGTGFGGKMTVQVVVKNGKISTVKILNHKDGSSYISKAKSILSAIVAKQSTNVDTVSGATYSSKGIIEAVRNALNKAAITKKETTATTEKEEETEEPTTKAPAPTVKPVKEDGSYKDGTYEGIGIGFGGEMKLKVKIKGGKITKISVVSKKDDEPFFTNAKALFDKIIKKQSTNVDTISGATYSSNGIIEAVRDALNKAKITKETSSTKETTKPAETIPQGKFPYKNGAYFGTAEGFKSDITVAVVIKNKTMTDIIITDEDETPSYFNRAQAVIDSILKKQKVDVDIVSGATFSSNGIINAVKEALKEAKKVTEGKTEEPETTTTKEPETTTTQAPTEQEPTSGGLEESESTTEKNTVYKDGTYSGNARCADDEDFDYTVSLKVTIRDDKITAITDLTTIGSTSDDAFYIKRATVSTTSRKSIFDRILESNSANVDKVSGATYTSNAIMQAVKSALTSAKR